MEVGVQETVGSQVHRQVKTAQRGAVERCRGFPLESSAEYASGYACQEIPQDLRKKPLREERNISGVHSELERVLLPPARVEKPYNPRTLGGIFRKVFPE